MARSFPPTIDRLFAKTDFSRGWFGCWVWTGAKYGKGYGSIKHNGKDRSVHRVSFELSTGAIDPNLTIDHMCEVKLCINPLHLEEKTAIENRLRAGYSKATHCLRGHEFDEKNTRNYNGKQHCRKCATLHQRAYRKGEKIADDRIGSQS